MAQSTPPQLFNIEKIINQIYRELPLQSNVVIAKENSSPSSHLTFRVTIPFKVVTIPSKVVLIITKCDSSEDYYSCSMWYDSIPVNKIGIDDYTVLFHLNGVHNICILINRIHHFLSSANAVPVRKMLDSLYEITIDVSYRT